MTYDRIGSSSALDRAEDELMNLRRENRELREALQATRLYDYHRWNCRLGEDAGCKECHDLKGAVVELRLDALDEAITLAPLDDPLAQSARTTPLIERRSRSAAPIAPIDSLEV